MNFLKCKFSFFGAFVPLILCSFTLKVVIAQGEIRYPYTAESILCLKMNPQTHQTEHKKYIEIVKIYSSPSDFQYSLSAAMESSGDYGTMVTLDNHGLFHWKSDIFEVSAQVDQKTMLNFLKPQNMEPFYLMYQYDNSILNKHDKLVAKCLHRIF